MNNIFTAAVSAVCINTFLLSGNKTSQALNAVKYSIYPAADLECDKTGADEVDGQNQHSRTSRVDRALFSIIKNMEVVHFYTVEPLLWGHPFFTRNVAFQERLSLIMVRNQYIYVKI